MDITYQEAKALVEAAISLAMQRNISVSVAVADSHGELVVYGRMDNAALHSGVLAQAKAYTAARERKPSFENGRWARETNKDMGYWADPKITGMGGGLPIFKNKMVIGGMGISGLTEEEDEQLVQEAMSQCGF
ncbi:heme-binding protein [bacterium]|nr:heme-binding protein [bacterium]